MILTHIYTLFMFDIRKYHLDFHDNNINSVRFSAAYEIWCKVATTDINSHRSLAGKLLDTRHQEYRSCIATVVGYNICLWRTCAYMFHQPAGASVYGRMMVTVRCLYREAMSPPTSSVLSSCQYPPCTNTSTGLPAKRAVPNTIFSINICTRWGLNRGWLEIWNWVSDKQNTCK